MERNIAASRKERRLASGLEIGTTSTTQDHDYYSVYAHSIHSLTHRHHASAALSTFDNHSIQFTRKSHRRSLHHI
jgi:glutamine phosphoribosylpyrophosphate amidotransferase